MIKKTITYTDYNGNKRTEDFWFNLNKAELAMMENSKLGGLQNYLTRIVNEQNNVKIVDMFQELILKSYGEKSDDGKYFRKSEELSTAFSQTEAYSELYMELATNSDAAAAFVNGIIPKDLAEETQKITAIPQNQ